MQVNFFLDLWDEYFPAVEAQRQFETAVDGGGSPNCSNTTRSRASYGSTNGGERTIKRMIRTDAAACNPALDIVHSEDVVTPTARVG